MSPKYLVQDNLGHSGQYIPLSQGESRTIKIFFQNDDGTPLVFTGTISEIVAKIYTGVSSASIQKTLTAVTITKLLSTDPAGMQGIEFNLTAANTAAIVANSSGIPVLVTITDSLGAVTELNFLELLLIDVPVVTN